MKPLSRRAFGLAVAALWVSSRGRFMFLDNVVHNRALVVDPWKRFRKQGNSLFLFSLALIASCVVAMGGLILGIAGTIGLNAWNDFETATTIGIAFAAFTALGTFVLGLLFTTFFLNAFVVPLMHRYDLGAIDGWRRFFVIFSKHAWAFLLCGLLVLILGLGIGILVVSFGLLTCCLGFLLLAIPYIGSVIMLPMSVFYRSFTLEFLAQFDPDLLPRDADPGTVKTLP